MRRSLNEQKRRK